MYVNILKICILLGKIELNIKFKLYFETRVLNTMNVIIDSEIKISDIFFFYYIPLYILLKFLKYM